MKMSYWSQLPLLYLKGVRHKIDLYTDDKGLEWFANNKPLDRRQARRALELDGFKFRVIHCYTSGRRLP